MNYGLSGPVIDVATCRSEVILLVWLNSLVQTVQSLFVPNRQNRVKAVLRKSAYKALATRQIPLFALERKTRHTAGTVKKHRRPVFYATI
jgi:hypothetical protein